MPSAGNTVMSSTEVPDLLCTSLEKTTMKATTLLFLVSGALVAQIPNPTQQPALSPANTGQPMPIFRITVVSRTTKAVNYHHRTGSTHIDFRGTELMPLARGEAKIASQPVRAGVHDVCIVGHHTRGPAREPGGSGTARRACQAALHYRTADVRP